jgi:hypothetical protein
MAITTDCDGVIRNGDYRYEYGKWVIDHDPNNSLDYSQDITDWLAKQAPAGDTIASFTVVLPTGVTMGNQSNDTTSMTAWLTGGAGAEDLLPVTYRMTSAHTPPRIKDWTFYLNIVEG